MALSRAQSFLECFSPTFSPPGCLPEGPKSSLSNHPPPPVPESVMSSIFHPSFLPITRLDPELSFYLSSSRPKSPYPSSGSRHQRPPFFFEAAPPRIRGLPPLPPSYFPGFLVNVLPSYHAVPRPLPRCYKGSPPRARLPFMECQPPGKGPFPPQTRPPFPKSQPRDRNPFFGLPFFGFMKYEEFHPLPPPPPGKINFFPPGGSFRGPCPLVPPPPTPTPAFRNLFSR